MVLGILVVGLLVGHWGTIVTGNGWDSLAYRNLRRYEHQKLKIETDRERWALEREEHESTARKQRAELEREIEANRTRWAQERDEHERIARRQREELERKRGLIAWGDLQASSTCTRYQTREYTATLYDVPFGIDPVEECYKRSVEINGHQEYPSFCEDQVSPTTF